MEIIQTRLPDVLLIKPRVFADPRGFFLEAWHEARYSQSGIAKKFVQDNVSSSTQGVLRGLHFQNPHPQGKLVSVLEGSILDVAVDIRVGSPTFGKSVSATLTSEKHEQLWVPEGFAHGFCVLSPRAIVLYKCTEFYFPENEASVLWNDPDLQIEWPNLPPILSAKDEKGVCLKDFPKEKLFQYGK